MKTIIAVLLLSLCCVITVCAEEGIIVKQGLIYTWHDGQAKNVTTATVVRTQPIDSAPKWVNMLVDGWVFDAGAAYEDETIKDGTLLVGREYGTLGKYIPWLIFPFKNRIQLSIYLGGVYLPDVVHHIAPKGCSGLGYIKGTLKF